MLHALVLAPWRAWSWTLGSFSLRRDSAGAANHPPHEGDRALVQRASRGDPQARRLLVRRLLPRVRRIARAMIGHPNDADDAAQNALLAILEATGRYRGDASVEHWARRITVRVVLRHADRERRHRADPEQPVDAMPAPASKPPGEELPRALREYLDELPAKQRQALLLRYALDHTIDEIAAMTGVGRDTVRGRLRLGAKTLRKLVRRELKLGAPRREAP